MNEGATATVFRSAEWAYAARGGEDYKYAGNNLDEVGWYDNSG